MFKKALLATALFALTHNSHAQFSQTVFFGDSLTDSGYYGPSHPPYTLFQAHLPPTLTPCGRRFWQLI